MYRLMMEYTSFRHQSLVCEGRRILRKFQSGGAAFSKVRKLRKLMMGLNMLNTLMARNLGRAKDQDASMMEADQRKQYAVQALSFRELAQMAKDLRFHRKSWDTMMKTFQRPYKIGLKKQVKRENLLFKGIDAFLKTRVADFNGNQVRFTGTSHSSAEKFDRLARALFV